jgi:hypothetical protein
VNIAKRDFRKIAEYIGRNIHLHFYDTSDQPRIDKILVDSDEPAVKICLYLSHYFIYEKVKGHYNTLKMIRDFHQSGKFVEGDLKVFHESSRCRYTKDKIFLNNIDLEQRQIKNKMKSKDLELYIKDERLL